MKFKKMISMSPKQFLLVLIPMLLVGVFVSFSFNNVTATLIKRNVIERVKAFVENEDVSCDSYLIGKVRSLEMVNVEALASRNKRTVENSLKNAALVNDDTTYFFATVETPDEGGFFVSSDDWEVGIGFDVTTMDWYQTAVDAEGNPGGIVRYDEHFGDKVMFITEAVYDDVGSVYAISGFVILLDYFSDATSGVLISDNSISEKVNVDGTYISNSNKQYVLSEKYFSHSKISAKEDESSYFDGEEKYEVIGNNYYAVKRFSNYPWFIVAEGPISDFTGDFKKWFSLTILITIVLIFCCVVINAISMNKMKMAERVLGDKLHAETLNLATATKENAATSQDQSASVKEMVATMEDTNNLSESISVKIKDVSAVAHKTSSDVISGVESLGKNLEKLHDIFDANQNTIKGIKSLGEKIENIWDIVTLINSVADQAKIIAFNAELEASSAGEAGKNFHIVATEIRRLADGIIDGTKEIKSRITEIQQSSDSLILASESGTEKINEGCECAKELEQKFESIRNASEITATSAEDITSIIQQQAVASEQMLATLKQIATGVENFTQSTENISAAAQVVQGIAEELSSKKLSDEVGGADE
ncbi:MAG: hypothetical protein IKN34_04420 [Treponema sp.]|nr:hypothetical protein [Treponema sp.]